MKNGPSVRRESSRARTGRAFLWSADATATLTALNPATNSTVVSAQRRYQQQKQTNNQPKKKQTTTKNKNKKINEPLKTKKGKVFCVCSCVQSREKDK